MIRHCFQTPWNTSVFRADALAILLVMWGPICLASEKQGNREAGRSADIERRRTPIVAVVEKTRGAVVNISAETVVVSRLPFGFDSLFDDIFEAPRKATGAGSGFLIHPSGYIVTNAHVVARSTDNKVTFADEHDRQARPARIVTIDREHDLAVLKIDTPRPLPYLQLGRSDDLMIGETVIAIGNPLGYHHTVTTGIIGAINRTLEFGGNVRYEGLIQTDAAINPGNSGGPLLNINGDLIGINTAIRGDAQNIGFAIPVDHLRRLLPEMMNAEIESRRRVWLGMTVSDKDTVRITAVTEGGPADRSGLRAGDTLLRVDDRPVSTAMDFYAVVLDKKAGDKLSLGLQRDGRAVAISLALASMPKPPGEKLAWDRLGLRLEEMTPQQAEKLGLPRPIGVFIVEVASRGPADRVGVRRGDILYQLGRYHGFSNLDDIGRLLKDVQPGDQVYISWLRPGSDYIYQYGQRLTAR